MSVIAALALTAPGLTLGAALSKSTRDLPCPSFPVTTRRMGRSFSVMWFYSIQLQARLLHDRGVPVVLPFEELGIFLRRVARRVQAERNEAAPDVRVLENLPGFGRKARAQFVRHSRGRHQADPAGHLVAGQVVGDGPDLGYGRRALRGRHGERPQASRFDEADDAGHRLDGVSDLAAHEVRYRWRAALVGHVHRADVRHRIE